MCLDSLCELAWEERSSWTASLVFVCISIGCFHHYFLLKFTKAIKTNANRGSSAKNPEKHSEDMPKSFSRVVGRHAEKMIKLHIDDLRLKCYLVTLESIKLRLSNYTSISLSSTWNWLSLTLKSITAHASFGEYEIKSPILLLDIVFLHAISRSCTFHCDEWPKHIIHKPCFYIVL